MTSAQGCSGARVPTAAEALAERRAQIA